MKTPIQKTDEELLQALESKKFNVTKHSWITWYFRFNLVSDSRNGFPPGFQNAASVFLILKKTAPDNGYDDSEFKKIIDSRIKHLGLEGNISEQKLLQERYEAAIMETIPT